MVTIKKLQSVRNFGSFQGFEWHAGIPTFSPVNILYGRNYSGKTTLSRILRCFETKCLPDRIDSPSFAIEMDDGRVLTEADVQQGLCIRVFNQDFVKDNLQFIRDPNGGVTPFAVLGAENAQLEQRIAEIQSTLGSRDELAEVGLYATLRRHQTAAGEATAHHNRLEKDLEQLLGDKATGRPRGIKYQFEKFGDQNYTKAKLQKELADVLEASYVPLEPAEQNGLESLLNQVSLPRLSHMPTIAIDVAIHSATAARLVAKQVVSSDKIQELIADVPANNWVHTGLELHSGPSDTCKFCGAAITEARWQALARHFDEESKRLQQELNSAIENIRRDQQRINAIRFVSRDSVYVHFQQDLDSAETALRDWQKDVHATLQAMITQLERRAQQLFVPLELSLAVATPNPPDAILQRINTIIDDSNTYTNSLANDQADAKKQLRYNEVFQFAGQIGYSERLQRIEDASQAMQRCAGEVSALQHQISTLEQDIEKLRAGMSDQRLGAEAVNHYLQHSFGHRELSLSLVEEPGTTRSTRFQICRHGAPAYHLSEGECSLIAFCYFVARLKDVHTAGQKPIIWIDDPICSLDGNHIYFIFSLIDAEIAQGSDFAQLFVSTHSLEFLRYLFHLLARNPRAEAKKTIIKGENFSWIHVSRRDGVSAVSALPAGIKSAFTEFSYLFEQIVTVSELCIEHEGEHRQLYSFGNDLRKFLEVFLYYRFPNRKFKSDTIELFLGDPVGAALVNRVINEYSHMFSRLERGSRPVDTPDLIRAARYVLEALKRDTVQYDALLQSIGRQSKALE
jgi:wobble nucleotide-excising tRNase